MSKEPNKIVTDVQNANALRAEQIEGKIVRITNGKSNDGSADRAFAGNPAKGDVVRIDVKCGNITHTNIRTSSETLCKALKRANAKQLHGTAFSGSIVSLKAGEQAVVRDAKGELAVITLESDRNQLTGEYFLSSSLNESIANAMATMYMSANSMV